MKNALGHSLSRVHLLYSKKFQRQVFLSLILFLFPFLSFLFIQVTKSCPHVYGMIDDRMDELMQQTHLAVEDQANFSFRFCGVTNSFSSLQSGEFASRNQCRAGCHQKSFVCVFSSAWKTHSHSTPLSLYSTLTGVSSSGGFGRANEIGDWSGTSFDEGMQHAVKQCVSESGRIAAEHMWTVFFGAIICMFNCSRRLMIRGKLFLRFFLHVRLFAFCQSTFWSSRSISASLIVTFLQLACRFWLLCFVRLMMLLGPVWERTRFVTHVSILWPKERNLVCS